MSSFLIHFLLPSSAAPVESLALTSLSSGAIAGIAIAAIALLIAIIAALYYLLCRKQHQQLQGVDEFTTNTTTTNNATHKDQHDNINSIFGEKQLLGDNTNDDELPAAGNTTKTFFGRRSKGGPTAAEAGGSAFTGTGKTPLAGRYESDL